MKSSRARVLVIDDVREIRSACAAVLERSGFQVSLAETGTDGLEHLEKVEHDVVLLDNQLPDMMGMDLLGILRRDYPDTEVIMMTAFGNFETAVSAIKSGAYDFLTKPFKDLSLITHVVNKANERRSLIRRARDLESQIGTSMGSMIGVGRKMQEIFRLIQDVATTDTTILITGDSGTGKELVAQAVHQKSNRKNKVMLALNCAAITDTLLESELFGHTKGAFTGAVDAKRGVFEASHQSSLFLDEIGDMTLATQVKLLRVLQEGEVRPVGGTEVRKVDVRVIAATNKPLEQLVDEGRFRQDLYYRLNVISIHLPSLRDRKEDVPLLANYFLQRYSKQYKKNILHLAPETLAILENYPWPGNVRELQHVMERAVVLCKSDELNPQALPEALLGKSAKSLSSAGQQTFSHLPYQEAKDEILSSFTLAYVKDLLKKTEGNFGKASHLAGMERSNFRRLVEKYKNKQNQSSDPSDAQSKENRDTLTEAKDC